MTVTAQSAKIAVYGAGAMGTVLGALLTKGGLKNVTLITRNREHVAGMKEKGATIVCKAENISFTVQVQALLPEEMTEEYDVIFLMTKQRNNAEILEFLLPKLKNDGIVCTTQNGFPEESVGEIIGKERTFGGVASFGATFLGGGMVALTSKIEGMQLQISPLIKTQETKEKLELLKEILSYVSRATGNDNFVRETENLAGARWSKLAINAAFSGLSVATGLTFGEIAKKRKTRKLALGILRECMDVANATGIQLEPMQGRDMQKLLGGRGKLKTAFALFVLPIAMKKHKKLLSGMLKDVQQGKRCEIDFIDGAVVEAGKRVGVATPLCERVVEIVHGIENGLYEIDYKNTDFLLGEILDENGVKC